MIKVYIAPHNMKRHNDGVMYDLAVAIQEQLKLSGNAEAIIPDRKQARRIKYDNIRDAKSCGARIFISLVESHIIDGNPTMGIFYSKLNLRSKQVADDLDMTLEGILPFDCNHAVENTVDNTIMQLEYNTPSIVFYINYNRDESVNVENVIRNNMSTLAEAFANAIRKHTLFIEIEDDIQNAVWKKGETFRLTIPNQGKIKAYSKFQNAKANGPHDYFLYSGIYIVYDYREGCINISNNASIPGLWIRRDDLE